MKLNIFARLNSLEEALANKQKALEAMQNSIEKLSDLVVFQGKVIGHLNKYAKFYPTPVVNEPQPETPKVEQPAPVVDYAKERIKQSKREWYQRNKEKVMERRKTEARRKKSVKASKTWYSKNKEKRREYSRNYYLKKKAERAAQVQS